MGSKRRQAIKRQGYNNWCPDYPPEYKYGGKILQGAYDRACYEEGHHKAQELVVVEPRPQRLAV